MNRPRRRLPARSRLEVLEGRALLSGAGTPDPTFGGGTGYSSASLGVPSLTPFALGGDNISDSATADSIVALPNGDVAEIGMIDVVANLAAQNYAELAITEFGPFGGAVASFGDHGMVLLPAEQGGNFAAAAEPNGDLVVAGGVGNGAGFAAVELDPSGVVVPGFGAGGVAQYPGGSATPAANRLGSVASVLLQPDGKIVLVGSNAGSSGSNEVAAVRLDADGSIDAGFGQGGTVNVPVSVNGFSMARASAAALQADGQIVVAGTAASGLIDVGSVAFPAQEEFALRLDADGSLDATYGGASAGGIVLLPDPNYPTALYESQVLGIAIDPVSGDALISGTERGDGQPNIIAGPTFTRLNTAGAYDTKNFRGDSFFRPGVAGPVAVQPDGDIVIAGTLNDQATYPETGLIQAAGVLLLSAEGGPVESFGNTTTPGLFIAHAPELTQVGGVAIEPGTGAIVVAGVGTEPSTGGRDLDFTAVRLLPTAFPTVPPARTPATAPADFAGTGYTAVAVYNPTNATFNFQSPDSEGSVSFGISGYNATIPAPADYLGIGSDQVAAYLPSLGVYAIQPSAGYTTTGGGGSPGLALKFGIPGYGQTIPVPADYEFDGDGKADVAIYLPEYASFAIIPSDGSAPYSVPFGAAGLGNSIPVPADYFGFGVADIAVYLPQVGAYAIRNPISGQDTIIPFGKAGYGQSIPVPGDYDGSGKTELAVYEPAVGAFFYAPADGGPVVEVAMGAPNSGAIPVPGDYDGSGRDEFAIYDDAGGYIEYRPANGGPDVFKLTDSAGTTSIPLAESPANLPIFNIPPPPPPISSAAKVRALSVTPATTGAAIEAEPVVTASAVPAGPRIGTARIPRALINQAVPDPIR